MMRKIWLFLGVILLVGCANVFGGATAYTTSSIATTGIQPDPAFAQFFIDNGGATIFGAPISGMFEFEGRQVQYFQRMRLELDDNGNPVISPLGQYFWEGRSGVAGAALENEFLDFYEANGGEAIFGAVLSPQLPEGERWVQYFENAIFEWHPGNSPENLVVVGELGQTHYLESGAKYVFTDLVSLRPIPVNVFERYDVSVALQNAILYQDDTQTVHVLVTTPEGNPAPLRPVEIRVRYEDGQVDMLTQQQTDNNGVLRAEVPPNINKPGQIIQIEVNLPATNGESLGRDGATYHVWW